MSLRLRGLDRGVALILSLCLLEVVMSWVDLLYGPWGRLHWEELFNARAGVQFACGHLDRAWQLQYRTFCGGCTVEGILAILQPQARHIPLVRVRRSPLCMRQHLIHHEEAAMAGGQVQCRVARCVSLGYLSWCGWCVCVCV